MANAYIYTPCDRLYEQCANYIVNDFNNEKCLNCLQNYNYKNDKNIVNSDKIKNFYVKGYPQRKLYY